MPKQRRTASQLRLVLRNGGKIPPAKELAERAFAIRYDDAAEMLELARLAVELARSEPQEVQAFTLTHLGNAQRINGLFLEAFRSFNEAEKLWGRPNPLLLQFRASLHQDRRQFRPAIGCLRRAARLATDHERRSTIKLKTAHVLDLSGEPRAAIEVVVGSLDDIDDAEMAGAALHGLAIYLTNAGEPERALFVLKKGLPEDGSSRPFASPVVRRATGLRGGRSHYGFGLPQKGKRWFCQSIDDSGSCSLEPGNGSRICAAQRSACSPAGIGWRAGDSECVGHRARRGRCPVVATRLESQDDTATGSASPWSVRSADRPKTSFSKLKPVTLANPSRLPSAA